jgi:hypothetical protein
VEVREEGVGVASGRARLLPAAIAQTDKRHCEGDLDAKILHTLASLLIQS